MQTESATYSLQHPHEPEVAPIYDAEGRCLICVVSVRDGQIANLEEQVQALETQLAGAEGGWEAANRLKEQVETLQVNEKDWSDQARRHCERINELQEQLEAHEAMLRRVLRYLNGSRYLVGADGLAEDVEALLSNPASRPSE